MLLEKFRVGEEVMMLAPQNTSTDNLRPKWRGPYKIARVISPAIYRVTVPNKPGKTVLTHANRLKKKL